MTPRADKLLYNGRVLTMKPGNDGRNGFVALGGDRTTAIGLSAFGAALAKSPRANHRPRREALRKCTLGSACASFEEPLKGSLKAGKLADITVPGEDVTTLPPEEIRNIPVRLTAVDGRVSRP